MDELTFVTMLAEYGPIGLGAGVLMYLLTLLISKGYGIKIDFGPRR
jgi:hypothetical protein